MQSQNLTALMADALKNPFEEQKKVQTKMEKLAVKNERDLSKKEVPQKNGDFMRVPTADELVDMRQWVIDYKSANRHDSKRQIRKAVQQHFNIRIYR